MLFLTCGFNVIGSAIFEDIDLKFCDTLFISYVPSNILYGFLKILILRGKSLLKKKMLKILENFGNFQNFENPEIRNFVALLILRHSY